jgi:phage terminase large subunit GpA-like protein
MAIASNRFNSFIEYVNEKAIDWDNDVFIVFLTNSAPVATNTVLADITEISYTNLSSRILTITAAGQTSGTYTATAAQLVLTASGAVGPFRYFGVADDTATGDPVVTWWDYGSAITMASADTFTIGAGATFTLWTAAPV